MTKPSLTDAIDDLLPQTQCARCGYDGCRPYAEAIAGGVADIDRCPPGGMRTIEKLAQLLAVAPKPLNPAYGDEPAFAVVALIDEPHCIGCFKCVLVCPVDAIVGAPKFMHTVLAAECSGCELCLPVCPTDCITLQPRGPEVPTPAAMAPRWRTQSRVRRERQSRERTVRDQARLQRRTAALKAHAQDIDIAAAVARARARRRGPPASAP